MSAEIYCQQCGRKDHGSTACNTIVEDKSIYDESMEVVNNLKQQLAEAKQWKDISVHQGLKIKLMEKENAKLRELLLEVWNDWKNSPNVNDPEADGYELLQKIKKAVKHE